MNGKFVHSISSSARSRRAVQQTSTNNIRLVFRNNCLILRIDDHEFEKIGSWYGWWRLISLTEHKEFGNIIAFSKERKYLIASGEIIPGLYAPESVSYRFLCYITVTVGQCMIFWKRFWRKLPKASNGATFNVLKCIITRFEYEDLGKKISNCIFVI